ncbi:oligosaccharide flippase family protein [Jannaschia sp. W003]|uniref:oligosaccharide flippase family protein n=1 Tax=Jannaschia sp. W003 TaxID=2867012 RepID=UPI0021A35E62|nr:oligosaccharide flippase family protein [Jannaschia sp. W003]UWQ23180.1 oligosaccharide flippase family protein [Jannaschia sp. W003]
MTMIPPLRRFSWDRLRGLLTSDGLKGRIVRGAAFTMGSFGTAQVLRLTSSLILTRLLFPEAFGLMALLQVVLTGLMLLSDTGLQVSVLRHPRGDDPDFLNTVWTVKVIRGVALWLISCALAWPMAAVYGEPIIAQLLPLLGLTLILKGINPTAIATADRHMRFGRVTLIQLSSQFITIATSILLAWIFGSVWVLVWGILAGAVSNQILARVFLPNSLNRFHWDGEIASELFGFGRWILLGTAASYAVNNADKMILGAFISLEDLGIYNIGLMLAMLAYKICGALKTKLLMPIYRMRPMQGNEANRRKTFAMRRLISGAGIAVMAVLAFVGIPLVDFLYDERYALAGPIVVLFCLSLIPQIITLGTGDLLLVSGDSWRAMHLTVARAVVQVPVLWFGVQWFGLAGAILAPAIAVIAVHPLRLHYARRYEGWDGVGEVGLLLLGVLPAGLACWLHREELAALFH